MEIPREDRPKFEEAIMMVSRAVELAYEIEDDAAYVPSEMDMTLLGRLCETLWHHYFIANHLLRVMHRRMPVAEN